jgi:hypothetical protein
VREIRTVEDMLRLLDGGVGYTPESLRRIFADLTEIEIRPMREDTLHFSVPFLWTALFRRPEA